MKKGRKVDKNSPDSDIRSVVDSWNNKFTDLQKRKEAGEKITNDDVRSIVVGAGEEIYRKKLSPSGLGATKLDDEFREVYKKVEGQKFPLSSVSDSTNDVKINPIQLAALESGDHGRTRGEIIADIVRDPDFNPIVATRASQSASPEAEQPLSAPVAIPVVEKSIEEKSAEASKNLLAKLAPPKELTSQPMPRIGSFESDDHEDKVDDIMPSKKGPKRDERKDVFKGPANGSSNPEDSIPAQVVQMPVQVVEPMESPNQLPHDALGRIIH